MTIEQQVLISLLKTSLDGNLSWEGPGVASQNPASATTASENPASATAAQQNPASTTTAPEKLASATAAQENLAPDWRKVMKLASEQTVAGQLYEVLEKHYGQMGVPADVKLAWYSSAQAIIARNKLVDSVLVDLVKALDAAGIPYLLFKGQGNARFYPRPELRSPGDIDIYIGPDNFEAAKSAWQAAGLVDKWDHEDVKHASFVCRGVSVEPHRQAELLPGRRRNAAWQAAISDALKSDDRSGFTMNGTFVRTLPVELNSVMVFIHMFRHFIGGGMRLRQFVDWVYICDQLPYTRRLREYLWDTGFERPWNEFSLMREVYFGTFKSDGRSVAIMNHLMNDAYRGNFTVFRLYPGYSLRFMFRLMRSHLEKYLKIR